MRRLTKEEYRTLVKCLLYKKSNNQREIEFMTELDEQLEISSENIQKKIKKEDELIDQLMDRLSYVAIDESAYLRHKK